MLRNIRKKRPFTKISGFFTNMKENLYQGGFRTITRRRVKTELSKLSKCALVHIVIHIYFCFISWLTRISNLRLSNVLETVQNDFQYSMEAIAKSNVNQLLWKPWSVSNDKRGNGPSLGYPVNKPPDPTSLLSLVLPGSLCLKFLPAFLHRGIWNDASEKQAFFIRWASAWPGHDRRPAPSDH